MSHVLHCKDPQAAQFAKTWIQETLKLKLTELGTKEALVESILDIVTRHRCNLAIKASLDPYHLQKAIQVQQTIG